MAKKIYPVFKFAEGVSGGVVTWYTSKEYTELKQQEKEKKQMETKASKYPSKEVQQQKYKEVVKLLHKEGTTKTNDFMGVEFDIYYKEYKEGEDYYTMVNSLFFNILTEMESMSDHGYEYVCDEYDDEQPFKTEYAMKQYIKRLGKFVVKYAPQYLETEKEIKYYLDEAKGYM